MKKEKEITKETAVDEKSVNQSSESSINVIDTAQAREQILGYAGMDSTAVIDIAFIDSPPVNKETKALDVWIGESTNPQVNRSKVIKKGIDFAKKIATEINKLINLTAKDVAKRAILLGMILLQLKELIKGSDAPWTVWAETNLPFIGERNREKYMMIGKRSAECLPLAFLGIDRLEMLCSSTKDLEGDDRIGNLLAKYNISFDDESEINMAEFKVLIDAALNNEKLLKKELTVDFALVKDLTLTGVQFDKSFLTELKHIQESGGSAEARIKTLSLNRGKDPGDSDGEKRLQDFNSLSNRLIKTIDYLVKDSDMLSKVDRETFLKLLEKLTELQKAANLTEEQPA